MVISGGGEGSSDLETVVRGEKINIALSGQKITLIRSDRGLPNYHHVIDINLPFGTYEIGSYSTERGARKAFQRYSSMLEEGCSLRLLDDNQTAKFIRKKS